MRVRQQLGEDQLSSLFDVRYFESDFAPAPRPMTHQEDAVAIVRHGLSDILAWLGDKPGMKPGSMVHTAYFLPDMKAALLHPETAIKIKIGYDHG